MSSSSSRGGRRRHNNSGSASTTTTTTTPNMVPSVLRSRAPAWTPANAPASANSGDTNGTTAAEGAKKTRRSGRGRKPSTGVAKAPSEGDAAAAADDTAASATGSGNDTRASKPAATKKKKKAKPAAAAATATASNTATAAEQEDDDSREDCVLCTNPIDFYAVGACNHSGICSKCSMRMRMIMKDHSCPMCKTDLDRVIVSPDSRPFDSFELWGDFAAGRDSVYDELSDMLFYECRAHYESLCRLREFQCRVSKCREVKSSLHQLRDHLRRDHGTEFCELCLEHQHFFVQEQQVFTKASLKAHNVGRNRATGPKQSGKDFHPMCQFCKRRFYGDAELYAHLERDHFKCHICKLEHEYFRNYTSLETHFRREHHLCEDPACLSNRYVVFKNDIEYQSHMSSIHGVQNRLLFNFQVARNGGNPIGGPQQLADDTPDSWNFDDYEVSDNRRAATPQARLDTAFPALPAPAGPAPPVVSAPAIVRPAVRQQSTRPPAAYPVAAPRGQVQRNQRLAQALGLARPGHQNGNIAAFEQEMQTPSYSTTLVEWGKANAGYLLVVERRLERIVTEPNCHSVSLRPMPAEERALMHELAEFYKVSSQSFGEDLFRRTSFFKGENMLVPRVTLSTHIRNTTRSKPTTGRLTYLPLRGSAAAAPAVPTPPRPVEPVSRGWEKIEPRRRPVIPDAWSDDEDAQDDASPDSSNSDGSDNVEQEAAAVVKDEAANADAIAESVAVTHIEDDE